MENLLISPLRERKSNSYHYHESWKSGNFTKENKERTKEIIAKMMQTRLRAITL